MRGLKPPPPSEKTFPQRLKPNICMVALAARLKSCPDTKLSRFIVRVKEEKKALQG
jgi:hypothetical protein